MPVCSPARCSLSSLLVRMRTGLDLDRHMAQAAQAAEPALVGRGRQRIVGDDRDHCGAMAGPTCHRWRSVTRSPLVSSRSRMTRFEVLVGVDIEQHRAGSRGSSHRPSWRSRCCRRSDRRIGPDPLRKHRDHQRRDGEHRRRGISQHMHIGRAEIVIVMMMVRGTVTWP